MQQEGAVAFQEVQGLLGRGLGETEAGEFGAGQILGHPQQVGGAERQGQGGAAGLAITAVAGQATLAQAEAVWCLCWIEFAAPLAISQVGPITQGGEKFYLKEDNCFRPGCVLFQAGQRPDQEVKEELIAVVFPGPEQHQFAEQSGGGVTIVTGAEGGKGVEQLHLLDLDQIGVAAGGIVQLQLGEGFKPVQKSLFAAFGTLGDAGEFAPLRTVEGDDLVSLAVVHDPDNHGRRLSSFHLQP